MNWNPGAPETDYCDHPKTEELEAYFNNVPTDDMDAANCPGFEDVDDQ